MEHPGVSGCLSAWGCGQGSLGYLGAQQPPREWGRGAAGSAVPSSCALSHLTGTGSRRASGLLPSLWGGRRVQAAPSTPCCVPRLPFQAQLQALVQAGGAIGHSALSPTRSCNSQLELVCTRLVQWYLSLLALSDLITRKKLNLTSCRCPEGTLENSCFSQRLLILHVRSFHSGLAINQAFAWSWLWMPDSPVFCCLFLR